MQVYLGAVWSILGFRATSILKSRATSILGIHVSSILVTTHCKYTPYVEIKYTWEYPTWGPPSILTGPYLESWQVYLGSPKFAFPCTGPVGRRSAPILGRPAEEIHSLSLIKRTCSSRALPARPPRPRATLSCPPARARRVFLRCHHLS